MAQAAKTPTTTAVHFLDPAKVPATKYGLHVVGNCMAPQINEGDTVTIDATAKVKQGDVVAIYLKRGGRTFAGGTNVGLKRVVFNMMPGLKYPYVKRPDSNVMPIIIVEQLNPPRQYQIAADEILAIHKCLGLMPKDAKIERVTPPGHKSKRQLQPA